MTGSHLTQRHALQGFAPFTNIARHFVLQQHALGVTMLLRPQRLRRFLRRLDARLWKWTGRRLAWSRLAGSGLLLLGTVLFLVLLAALLLRALY